MAPMGSPPLRGGIDHDFPPRSGGLPSFGCGSAALGSSVAHTSLSGGQRRLSDFDETDSIPTAPKGPSLNSHG
jgi:hypothetical protein